jgi:hypothetical protein
LGHTVQQNNDLTTRIGHIYMNIIGNGALYQFTTPVTDLL